MGKHTFSTLLVSGIPFTAAHRARLAPFFSTINHIASTKEVPDADVLAGADIVYGFTPDSLASMKQVPKLQYIQLASAGSEHLLESPLWKEKEAHAIGLATAAGVHTGPIPQVRFALV